MDERNELNDIILNKTDKQSKHKKILLAVTTLAIILIIVVVIMNQIGNKGTSGLPKAHLPPEASKAPAVKSDDGIFEPVTIVEEKSQKNTTGHNSAIDNAVKRAKQKAKADSSSEQADSEEIVIVEQKEIEPKRSKKPMEVHLHRKGEELIIDANSKKKKMSVVKSGEQYAKKPANRQSGYREHVKLGATYIQVGSFSKYKPNKKFLNSITNNGFSYTYHRVVRNGKILSKVLIGPFKNRSEAQHALMRIRKRIETDAFIITSLK